MAEMYVKVDDVIEYCDTYIACLQGQSVARSALRRVKEYVKAEATEAPPTKSDEYERGFHDGIRSEVTRELVEGTSKLVESVMESIRICLSKVDIEAIPVKRHGHWLICSDGYYPYCSECGHRPKEMSKFCEECGADMREEGKK